jgi:hypothetical protein
MATTWVLNAIEDMILPGLRRKSDVKVFPDRSNGAHVAVMQPTESWQ